METNYQKIGVKIGLEIHQQLATSTKLFCNCPPELSKNDSEHRFHRRLRPTQSELGQIDSAAYFEFEKGVQILYEADNATSCLVEMDEEPPHPLNMEAVEVAVKAAYLMKARPVDEIHVMRKTVIDGSNTGGFQRTCVIALNGVIQVGQKTIPIQHVSLEEDAARKMGEDKTVVRYRIDRLGIPLIEVATAPVITSPHEAGETALAIGKILRATGQVQRGIGTIRQDLNISLAKGALIEIKGVQELALLPLVVEYEVQRQLGLLQIREELRKEGVRPEEFSLQFKVVTTVFHDTKCQIIAKALEKNLEVLAVKLTKFTGFLKRELLPNFRLASEMADRARFWGKVGGIFHTDELPAYGITIEEVDALRNAVHAREQDAVVFVADTFENAKDALTVVVARAREALHGVPEETRAANPDGTTRYMRPRPGAARMYPETDIPPIQLTEAFMKTIRLPELPEQRFKRLRTLYGLNTKLANQILDSEHSGLFDAIVQEHKVSPTIVAVFLTETLKALKRDNVPVTQVSEKQIRKLFQFLEEGKISKEALPEIVVWLSTHEEEDIQVAIDYLHLQMIPLNEVERIVDRILRKNRGIITERGVNAFGPIMGAVMKEVRGKADAALVSDLVKTKLRQKIEHLEN